MTTPPTVTTLADARELKAAGLPPNIPLEHREFSREYTKHWFGLHRAQSNFVTAVKEYSDGARAGSPGKWQLLKRRLASLCKAMQDCDAFIGKVSGGSIESPAIEAQIMAGFLVDRAMPFAAFWEEAVAAVDGGTPLTINFDDIPPWIDAEGRIE